MKLALAVLSAILLASAPAAPVRYEADGLRVGSELVSGAALQLKTVDASTLLVSGSAVETLGAPVDVALDAAHAVTLQAGLRLERRGDSFLVSSHGPALAVDVAGRALRAESSLAFTLTPGGFDFGALGAVQAAAFAVRAEPAQQDGIVSPERRALSVRTRGLWRTRVFKGYNPTVQSAAADRAVIATLVPVSVIGGP